ncbi:MAG: penicillin-binding protein 2 [Treponema sp.]|jgi:penicillin-binding protein 2|nr:penicillin-binding protein 2 [Treponema sp.]
MPPLNHLSSGDETPERRIRVLGVFFIVIFAVYTARLFSMQILQGDVYRREAQDIARRTTVIPPQRGEIFDRNFNSPLALNTDSYAVNITPAEVPRGEMPALLERVGAIIGVSRSDLENRLPAQSNSSYQPVELAVNVPYAAVAALAENADTLRGISWQSKPLRTYADAGSLSHILGYVGDITRDELTMLYNRGYQAGDVIGKAGIERQYDEILRGKEGREVRTVDVRGRRVSSEEQNLRTPPEMGKNLVLTIDRDIQTLAEKALGARMGSVVVMRPSGEILAMVSYPWYDPNLFNRGGMSAEYQALINDPNKPFLNRAIQSNYPPASTFKVVMTTGILAENVISPEQTVNCQGEFSYGERLWRCHIRRPGHGRLNLRQAMAQSCDIYYWVVGRDYLGVDRIISYAKEYGFGENTGVDLPGEISGIVPTPEWKETRIHEKWLGGDTMNMSIGQGYTLVTPIQMACMVGMVLNNGTMYKPHILKEVRDPVSGAVERSVRPEVIRTSGIDAAVFEQVKRDMRGVISGGTAQFPLNIKTVEVAGKTGTGEVGLQDRWHSWFAAYAPYTGSPDEQVIVSVIVEASNRWEWWAPYASAIIFQGIFAGQSYEEAVQSLGFQYLMTVQGRRE